MEASQESRQLELSEISTPVQTLKLKSQALDNDLRMVKFDK